MLTLIGLGLSVALVAVLLAWNSLVPRRARVWSVPYGVEMPGETVPRRRFPQPFIRSPAPDVNSAVDILRHVQRAWRGKRMLGHRVLERVHREVRSSGESWDRYELSRAVWLPSEDVCQLVLELSTGLHRVGLRPGDRVGFFAETRYEWLVMALAVFSRSGVVVTAYSTLGVKGVAHSFDETECRIVFTSADGLSKVLEMVANEGLKLSTLVYCGQAEEALLEDISYYGVRVVRFESLRDSGRDSPLTPESPAFEDTAVIMYTSGATGEPKGVELMHGNLVGLSWTFKHIFHFEPDDVFLAYLPLAHIFELSMEINALYHGMAIAFGTQRTLTEASCVNCNGDFVEYRPTFLIGVPTVFSRLQKAVEDNIRRSPPKTRALFQLAFQFKHKFFVQSGLRPAPLARPVIALLDRLVFRKTAAILGGEMRVIICGSAPLPPSQQDFLRIILPGTEVLQGYGLTESGGAVLTQIPGDESVGNIGPPLPHAEVKLVDVPDMGYLTTNPNRPAGEIAIRGPTVARGYFRGGAEFAGVFSPEGWLFTGDIGELLPSGSIAIIDRKKNLVKQACGEYVALEKLDQIFSACTFVDQFCCVADSAHDELVALVVPSRSAVAHWAEQEGMKAEFDSLLQESRLKLAILRELREIGVRAKLSSRELVTAIHLSSQSWSPENGLLTPSLKLKRGAILAHFAPEIETLFMNTGQHSLLKQRG